MKYKMYKDDTCVGTFEVLPSGSFSITVNDGESFCGMRGIVSPTEIKDWIAERIIPPTRINIHNNLAAMGLNDYDVLDILKFTKAKSCRDEYWINFDD